MQWLAKVRSWLPPMPTTPPRHSPHRSTLLQLAVLIGLALILHLKIADWWIGGFAIVVFLVKVIALWRNAGPPNKLLLVILTIFSLGLVIVLYGGWNGQRAGISFLVLLLTLKFLESEALRDYFVVCLILYFLAASSFLFDSSIFSIFIVTAYTLAITSILFQISNPTPQRLFDSFKQSANIVVRALPLALILFFLFPRIHGSFGFIPSLDKTETGLADALVAGEMADAAFNQELAFRVNFVDNSIPSQRDLYWRVKTMSTEIDFAWETIKANEFTQGDINTGVEMRQSASLNQTDATQEYNYTIWHERTPDQLLPYLDFVAGNNTGKIRFDYSVLHPRVSSATFSYDGRSTLSPSLNLNGVEVNRARNLNTQSTPSARMLAFLSEIRRQASSDAERATLVYNHIRSNDYAYSVTPVGLDEQDRIGSFWFDTKVGYCEHYASAYTTIMRWLGIPARIVVGYQGGEIIDASGDNPFIEVRYSDAHAWSEVWMNGQWQRVDPTAAVNNDRIEYGMQAIREDLFGSNYTGNALSDYLNPSGSTRLWLQVRDSWKSIAFQWEKWIVNYDAKTQLELLKKLGFDNGNHLLNLMILLFGGATVLLLFYFLRMLPKPTKRLQEQTIYLDFVRHFKKLGVEKAPSETPLEFAKRVQAKAPWHQQEIVTITKHYLSIRYHEKNSEDNIKAFKKLVSTFKLRPSP